MGTLFLFQWLKNWATEFKRGPTNLEDGLHKGHTKHAIPGEITEQTHYVVLDNQGVAVHEIARLRISNECVWFILYEEFCMGTTLAHNRSKMHSYEGISLHCLGNFKKNKTGFVLINKNGWDLYIHQYTPESKQQ